MAELKTRVEELRLENDYQLRLKDMTYSEKIKELTEKFIQEMEALKTKNQANTTNHKWGLSRPRGSLLNMFIRQKKWK